MFVAVDEFDKRVSITSVEDGKDYYCPVCKEKLTVRKKGKVKAPHFAHKPGSDCEDWGDMSEWHLSWQEKFPEGCREVVLEKDGERHRADVCIEEKKLVIEFQHSSISNENFIRRNRFYTGCGYHLIWVFDATNKLQVNSGFLEWKRKQSTFFDSAVSSRNVYGKGKIIFYLETEDKTSGDRKRLLKIQELSNKYLKAYDTVRPILQENFLKEYGGAVGGDVRSIREIFEETEEIERKRKEWERQDHERRFQIAGNAFMRSFLSKPKHRRW